MLSIENVSVSYGAIRAVQDVALRVEEGEFVALLGPNGAGKTSLISAIVGLAPRLVEQIFELISTLRVRGLTLLVVEQNAHDALLFADRAYVLSTGHIRYEGNARELASSEILMTHYLGTGTEVVAGTSASG